MSLQKTFLFLLVVVLVAVSAAALLPLPLNAQGMPVHDAAATLHLISQLEQLRKQYTTLLNQYEQIRQNARWLPSSRRINWTPPITPWSIPTAQNTHGNTDGWLGAVNQGFSSAIGYARTAETLMSPPRTMDGIHPTHAGRLQKSYGNVELTDGLSASAMDQLGNIRKNAPHMERAINALAADSLSEHPNLNTQVALLNKVNAGQILAIRSSQDTNKLLAAMLDQQLTEQRARRDAQVQSINNAIVQRQIAPELSKRHLSGTATAIRSFRLP